MRPKIVGFWGGLGSLVVAASAAGQAPAAPGLPAPLPAMAAAEKPHEWPKEISGKDLKGWLAELNDSKDGAAREAAVKIIPMFGPVARKDALRTLIAVLKRESDPGVKVNIILVLGGMGADDDAEAKAIVDAIKPVITNSGLGSPYRLQAARALANYGPNSVSAIVELKTIVEDLSWETRRAVAYALGRIGHAPDDGKTPPAAGERKGPNALALKILTDRLAAESSAAVRLEIVQSLIILGPPGFKNPAEYPLVIKPQIDAVQARLKLEKEKSVLVWLHVLLMLYDGTQLNDQMIHKVAAFISGSDSAARVAALRALGMLGEHSKVALPAIIAALSDEQGIATEAILTLAALKTARP